MDHGSSHDTRLAAHDAWKQQRKAMRLSLAVGVLMLVGKWYAYSITGSAAILSDAAESVVHVIAVAFAAFSLWLSRRPADESHPYGHEKIGFFSAGTEGALIVLAAAVIVYEAIVKWLGGLQLQNLGTGTLFVAGAGLINAALGGYLVLQGRRHGSVILVANGKHVLTDSWTSLGVIVGLLLTIWTGWLPFDPLLAIFVALNILWSGTMLMRQSVGGLMDEGDPNLEKQIRAVLDNEAREKQVRYHELRYRNSGRSLLVEFHLLFPKDTSLQQAHWQATEVEAALRKALRLPTRIVTHLEPDEDHDSTHRHLNAEDH
jgi:cation diffusion facilitator family transporter